MSGSGTRAGEAVDAKRDFLVLVLTHQAKVSRESAQEAVDDFAAAVRAEHGEQIAQEYREHFYSHRANGEPTHWHQGCNGCSEWMQQLSAARLAREASE